MQARLDRAADGLEPAGPARDAAQVLQGHDQSDGAVAAHIQVADIIEEDDAASHDGSEGSHSSAPTMASISARLIDHRRAEMVEPVAEALQPFGHRAAPEIGTARDNHPRRLASGVGIDNVDPAADHARAASAGRVAMACRMMPRISSRSAPSSGSLRRPRHFRAEPGLLHRQLDVLDQLYLRIQMQQRRVPAVQLARFLPFSGHSEVPQFAVLVREGIHQAGDPALRAQQNALENQIVHTGEKDEAVAHDVHQVGDPADVFRGLLDRDDILHVHQLEESRRGTSTPYDTGLL